jgi:hypothetical protein
MHAKSGSISSVLPASGRKKCGGIAVAVALGGGVRNVVYGSRWVLTPYNAIDSCQGGSS